MQTFSAVIMVNEELSRTTESIVSMATERSRHSAVSAEELVAKIAGDLGVKIVITEKTISGAI